MEKQECLEILNVYRERIKYEYEKPGWNKWVLLGALASLIWLLLDIIEKENYNIIGSILIFFISFVGYSTLELVDTHIKLSNTVTQNTTYLNNQKFLKRNLASFIISSFTCIVLCIINYSFLHLASIYIYFSIILLFLLFNIIPYFIDIPIAIHNKNNFNKIGSNIIYMILYAISAIVLIELSFEIHIKQSDIKISSIKLGLVFFTLNYVINRISISFQTNPLLNEIDNIIDSVVFDNLKTDEALKNVKLLIFGLEFTDIIGPIVSKQIEINQMFEKKYQVTIDRLNQYENANEANKSAFWDAFEFNANELISIIKDIEENYYKIKKKLDSFYANEKNNNNYISIREQIDKQFKYQMQAINLFIEKINTIKH